MNHIQRENVSEHGRFYVGMYGKFKGLDPRGSLTIKGQIKRLWLDDRDQLFAAIKCDEVIDKFCGLIRYDGKDVARTLQLTGELVDILHGRLTAATV